MKILVFNPSFLGDSVLTTPLIKAVKHYFNDSIVDFCVRPENVPLFEGLDIINEVIPFDKRKSAKGVSGIFRFAREIKKRDYDIIISCHKSLRSTLTLAFSGVLLRVGFRESACSYLYTETVSRDMQLHEVERNLMLLQPLVEDFDLDKVKKIAGTAEVFVDERLVENIKIYMKSIFSQRRLVGINPGSVWETKKWLSDRFAKVCDKLYEKGCICVLYGAPTDLSSCNDVQEKAKHPVLNLCGRLPLGQLPSYIKAMDLLITNDSGPLHIASAVGTPSVAIFGPTVKSLGFFPYDTKSVVVEKDISCRPCGLHGGHKCPQGHFKCMKDIDDETVFKEARKVLDV